MFDNCRPLCAALFRFFAAGVLVIVATWLVLAAGTALSKQLASRPRIKTVMNTDPIGAGGQISWDTIEVQQFKDYARKQGWHETELTVARFVGDDTQKYVASQIAGESPDVVIASDVQVTFFDDNGLIEPLDAYLTSWSDYRAGYFNQEILDMCRGRDGKVLGLPVYQHSPAFYAVRSDWLNKLGLESPETFAEAHNVWTAFTFQDPDGNGEDDTYGFELSMATARGQHVSSLTPFMCAVRVPWYTLDENGGYLPAFNTPNAAFVLDFIKQCYKEGLFGKDAMERGANVSPSYLFFSQAAAGMASHYASDWFMRVANQHGLADSVKIVPFLWQDREAKRRKQYGTFANLTRMRCLMKAGRNKEVAWQYLQYFFSREWLSKTFVYRGQPFIRGRYLGMFGLFTNEPPWRMLRNDVIPEIPADEEIVRLIKPLDDYVIRHPLMSAWTEVSVALAEVFVDYYLDRYPESQAALDEAERRFIDTVESHQRRRDAASTPFKKMSANYRRAEHSPPAHLGVGRGALATSMHGSDRSSPLAFPQEGGESFGHFLADLLPCSVWRESQS